MPTTTGGRAAARLITAGLLLLAMLVSIVGPTTPAAAAPLGLATPYTQSFDTLMSSGTTNPWSDDSTLEGWYATRQNSGTFTAYRASSGSDSAGALYSFGTTADRALGSISSGTPGTIYYGVRLVNNTADTITALDVSYTGEQWRNDGSSTTNQRLAVSYQVGATSLTSGTWTDVSSLDFVAPIAAPTSAGATMLDGNNAANRTAISATISGLSLAPGQEIWLRWVDINDPGPGGDQALAIDDVSITAASAPTGIDLSTYVRIGRYNLPVPSRTTAPAGSQLALEVSTVTYNPETDTLFVLGDEGTAVVQISKTGQLISSMTLTAGDFEDPEGLTYAGATNQFVLVEERLRQANRFTYVAGGTLSRADVQSVKLGTTVGNIGLEGISFDPQTGGYILVKETSPQGIFQTGIDFAAGTATNGSPSTENASDLFDPALAGLTDIADVYALSNLPAPLTDDNLLVLSQEDGKIINIDRTGNSANSLTITADPGNPLTVAGQGHEGVTMAGDGLLYVVSEQGGGDGDHPQLWVYAPASYVYANAAPIEVSLSDVTTSLPENSDTAAPIQVGSIIISDDALGTNTLSLSGADAAVFEIVGAGLFLKAGTALDFETKPSYAVTVTVDDVSVGSAPDASRDFTLEITDTADTPATLIISEVAPWSSGNSPGVTADWFEVTNVSASTIDITGWRIDDSSASFASSAALSGVTSLAPGRSAVFIEGNATRVTAFVNTWFGGTPPTDLPIGTYSGSGLGLSTDGDAVNLFDAGGTLVTGVTFGASPSASPFATFDNAAGSASVATLSAVGVDGAFSVIDGGVTLIGSPGTIGGSAPGQALPLSEGFDSCPPTPTGWQIVSVDADTANTWSCGGSGDKYAEANGFGDTAAANEWLITPPLNMDAQTGEALTFRSATTFADSGVAYPQLKVVYSTNYSGSGDPAAATWAPLTGITFAPENSSAFVDSGTIDLASITGSRVYFAFNYQSSGTGSGTAARWRVDAINFAVDTAGPTVSGLSPADGAAGVALSQDLVVTFNEAVRKGTGNITIHLVADNSVVQTIDVTSANVTVSGAQVTINPPADLATSTAYYVNIAAGAFQDPAGNAFAGLTDATTWNFTTSAPALTRISAIQGSSSAVTGAGPFTVEAIVVGDYQTQGSGQLRGFFLQEEDADSDSNPATSEGIFVFCSSCPTPVAVGDKVQVTGAASEFFNLSQLTATTAGSVTVLGANNALPTPASVQLPVPNVPSGDLAAATAAINAYFEPFESMLVTFPSTLTISEYFELARYGQVILSAGGRPRQFTDRNAPSVSGYTNHEINLASRTMILDDTDNRENRPLDTPNTSYYYPVPGLSTSSYFRGGDTITNLTGVLHWSFAGTAGTDAWRIRPVVEQYSYAFTSANPRPAVPGVGGNLKVASFNVLNYFLTIDTTSSSTAGACGASATLDCRGPDSVAERDRQQAKLTAALNGLNADVVGLIELENTPNADPLAKIVADLNAVAGAGTYAAISTGVVGTDAIKVGLIYKPAAVTPVGQPFIDTNAVHNRPPVAQLFQAANGARLTVVVNHFKSKGCTGATGPDLDQADGQGCFNAQRVQQAQALLSFIGAMIAQTGDPDVLIIGDLNAYAQEGPITTLMDAGYSNLVAQFGGPDAYSYVFDGQLGYLDHALASASLAPQVSGTAEWHINADEIPLFDYNDDVRDTGESSFEEESDTLPLYAPNAFRTSDHDPVIVGLSLNTPNRAPTAADQRVTVDEDGSVAITLAANDADGNPLTYSVVSPPANGTLSGTAPNLTYTPSANFNGSDSFTFKANDGTADSNVATVSITVSPVVDPATLTIVKSANPAAPWLDWTFQGGGAIGAFTLDNDPASADTPDRRSFEVAPGSYTITETNKLGNWDLTISCSGGASFSTSGAAVTVTLAEAKAVTCTFLNQRRPQIEITKYNDLDGDGSRDGGELGIDGWQMFLYLADGSGWKQIQPREARTNQNGIANYTSLQPGVDHLVCEESRAGWANTQPGANAVSYDGKICQVVSGLVYGEVRAVAFGNREAPAAQTLYRARQVGDRVWIERNIAEAGLGDFDGEPVDGWALVGRTNGAADNGTLRGFYVEDDVPYAIVFNRSRNKGDRCILLTPKSLKVVKKGQTRLMTNVNDSYTPCPATPAQQLP